MSKRTKAAKSQVPGKPAAPPPAKLPETPAERERRVRHTHTVGTGGHVYLNQTAQFADHEQIRSTAMAHVDDVVRRLGCRDPLEEMLAVQALWCHARAGKLSLVAGVQTQSHNIKIVNDAADRASATFGRLMRALAEYRRPPRSDSFVAIRQANVARQQVVQHVEGRDSKQVAGANEKGLPAVVTPGPAALPALPGRAGGAAGVGPDRAAVAEHVGATDGDGQGPVAAERLEARRA